MHDSRKLVVIGHRNPDTDSICSALSYAWYKNAIGEGPAEAFRAGNVNAQTRYALDRFSVPAPALLTDVHPRLRDIMIPRTSLFVLRRDDPIADAKDLLIRHRFTFLPVADHDDSSTERITALRLVELMNDIGSICARDSVTVDLHRFRELCGASAGITNARDEGAPHAAGDVIRGRLILDLGCVDLSPQEWHDAIVVIDRDRADAIIAHQPRAVIVTGSPPGGTDAPGGEDVRAAATPTPGDATCVTRVAVGAAQAAVNLFFSMPIGDFAEKPSAVFRESDLVRDVAHEINRYNDGGFIVTDANDRITGVVTRTSFLREARLRVAMVDHNELSQAVDGIAHAEITEVIDHHRLGGPNTTQPITFINRVVGSTSTIVADLFRQRGVTPDAPIAGMMLSGLLSDTVILKSPTTTAVDREIAAWLATIAGVDINEYGHEMFVAGSGIEEITDRQIISRDQKTYTEASVSFSVSQIEMIGFGSFWSRKESIMNELAEFASARSLSFAALMVTDITTVTTLLAVSGSERLIEHIRYPEVAPGVFELKGVLSRKKQLLPYLIEIVRLL